MVVACGIAVTSGEGQIASVGVGLAAAVEVEIGVGEGGGPGQIEMLCKNAPGGEGMPQGAIGTPPVRVAHGVAVPPPPQFQEKATASRINAAPSRIHRALSIIGLQL